MATTRTLGALALTTTVLLAGCGGATDAPDTATDGTTPASSAPVSPAQETPAESSTEPSGGTAVPEALQFEATTVEGDPFAGASAAGKPVVLWFWAPWCAVCRSQVPLVDRIASDHEGQLTVLGVGSLDSGEAIEQFAGDAPGITHLSDPDGELWQRFGISEQSSFVVLDAAGEEALRTGYADDDRLEDVVDDVTAG